MLNGEEVVQCQISDAAMDELAGMEATESRARHAQFLSLRSAMEQIASDIFDGTLPMRGVSCVYLQGTQGA